MVKSSQIYTLILFLLSSINLFSADWYVATNGTGQGTSWSDATNNLTNAISRCLSNFTVWVQNGTICTNYIGIPGGVTVRSKSGNPQDFIVNGNGIHRCVGIEYNGVLLGCTITNGYDATEDGPGVYGGIISNCIVSGNISGIHGGGIAFCTAYNTIIRGNTSWYAGGAYMSTLYNCIVSLNITTWISASIADSTAYNCTFYGNVGASIASTYYNCITRDADDSPTAYYSCGAGLLGTGCITDDPLLVDEINGNFNLQSSSPCINVADNTAWSGITNSLDMNKNRRIWPIDGIVDMGAYEYNSEPFPQPLTNITYFIIKASIDSNNLRVNGTSLTNFKGRNP